ncbi:hypothetical protein [Pseudomonas sp. NA-150]|uniref:hypothetical protein n=1 Tax=Pseudomonas sp. NA-150 TaxID=3367525 RepID=UPI0037C52DC3
MSPLPRTYNACWSEALDITTIGPALLFNTSCPVPLKRMAEPEVGEIVVLPTTVSVPLVRVTVEVIVPGPT